MSAVVVLLTLREVAERLRKTEPQARYMKSIGDFPKTAKIGGRIMIRESDLDAYLASKFDDVA